ncbi:hypothetical protein R3P38DRAFT_2632453 [Favolaschia claudopus]|uniref:Uncharacterized protein n=1 Tax=Favolaschia claudopus TaxID=2862362 RepID=A0AAW0B3Y8_9AGAR
MDLSDWQVPDLNIAYSRGEPTGRTLSGKEVYFDIMVNEMGEKVPCIESHSTCQGVKICPYADRDSLLQAHTTASLANIQTRLRNDRENRLQFASPTKDIFCRTAAYLTATRKLGCSRPLDLPTNFSEEEEEQRMLLETYWQQVRRGQRSREGLCEGKLLFFYDSHNRPHVRCQHYDKITNPDHFHDDSLGTAAGTYDLNYIKAVLTDDNDEVARIEEAAFDLGYGPRVECTTVANNCSQRAICPHDHRNDQGQLIQPLMDRLRCSVRFRVIEPLEPYRTECPFVLVISTGPHTHPIPLPTKTPPVVRQQVFKLLDILNDDIADITPRRFLRHPILKAFLAEKFPRIPHPTLSHLHISLANRSRIKAYIKQIKEIHCPFGTAWEAIEHLKKLQDSQLPACEHYIRRMFVLDPDRMDRHEEDDEDIATSKTALRVIICMSPEASRRLVQQSRYLQSDIAFQRIVDYLEFELACMDRDANTSLIFCRVFLNRQTAVAHQLIFQAIHELVYADTGRWLRWRHLHAQSLDDYDGMVLQWGADQHRGQAKGLGLFLQSVAASLPPRRDLHEPGRTIQDLSPYEHLHRVFRLCSVHFFRNIKASAVPDEVKQLMRSLLCLEHSDWEGTLAAIEEKGGKTGRDWVKDKRTTHFAFQALCWEKSLIPRDVWMAGDTNTNLIESVHRDVNREGVQCTLLGGLQKGQAFDAMKMRTLQLQEMYGVHPTYLTGHISENAFKNLRRRDQSQRRTLLAADQKIETFNRKLQNSYDVLEKARHNLWLKISTNLARHDITAAIDRLTGLIDKAHTAYDKLVLEGKELEGTGTGRVAILKFDAPVVIGNRIHFA